MLIEEMHIGIDMELQKVSTYTQRNLQPQEIDWFLNKEVIKFIKQRTEPLSNLKRKGADDTIKRYEDLSDLTKEKELDIELNSDNTIGTCILPDDYYSYISSNSNVKQLCDGVTNTFETKSLYVCVVPLTFTNNLVVTEYKIEINEDSGDTELFRLSTSLPSGYIQNVDINKQRFMLLKGIKIKLPTALESHSSNTYSLYWERYKDMFYNNSFIIVSTTPFNSISTTTNLDAPVVFSSEQKDYKVLSDSSILWAKNRIVEDEFLQEMKGSYLSKSSPESPILSIEQGILKIEFPISTICKKVKLRYTSNPTILDKALSNNLNMKDTIANEIVSNTVRFLKGVFKGDYQTYLNENVMIE